MGVRQIEMAAFGTMNHIPSNDSEFGWAGLGGDKLCPS